MRRRWKRQVKKDIKRPCAARHHLQTVIDLNKADTTGDRCRGPVNPSGTSEVNPLVQGAAVGEIDEVEEVVHIVDLPDHLVLGASSGSAHREGDLGALVGEGEGNRFGSGNDAEDIWSIADLEPKHLTIGMTVGLLQELHRVDLWNTQSVYAL